MAKSKSLLAKNQIPIFDLSPNIEDPGGIRQLKLETCVYGTSKCAAKNLFGYRKQKAIVLICLACNVKNKAELRGMSKNGR